jgi:16S rRNA processing protein RimM
VIALAKVLKPHGVNGAVVVALLTSRAERIEEVGTVHVGHSGDEAAGTTRRVVRVGSAGRRVVVELEGVGNAEAADALRGMLLLIPDGAEAPLPPGEYYDFQIVGCSVWDESGSCLGTVTEVLEMPAQDVYVVALGDRTWWLPAAKALIERIDISSKRITVRAFDGLLETGPAH